MKISHIAMLLLLGVACRRPSRQIAATLTPASKATQTVTVTSIPELPDFSQHLKAGDEWIASGNEPFWSLTINPSKNLLRFRALNGDSLDLPFPPRADNTDDGFQYETDKLTVRCRPDSCLDSGSGRRFDYQATVTVGSKRYVGCGTSLRHMALLQDIWVLKTLNGRTVSSVDSTSERPRLEIQLTEGRVVGTTGCNRLSGPVKADNRHLRFGPLITTRMACVGESGRLEGDFLEMLSQSLTYRLSNGTLTLSRDSRPVMTFQKVD